MTQSISSELEANGVEAELPEGWAGCSLSDHVYIAGRIGWRGLKAEEYTSHGPILLSVPNLNHGDAVDFGTVNHISQVRYDESPEIKLRIGDTLLVKDGAGIGKLGYVQHLPGEATVNSSLLLVRPEDGLLSPKYLFYYLKGPKFQRLALERITGSATPHLFQKDIKVLRILVPPPAEQNRIVQRIDECLADVTSVRQNLSGVPLILKRFRQAVLAAACSGRLSEDWRIRNQSVEPAQQGLERLRVLRQRKTAKNGVSKKRKTKDAEPLPPELGSSLDIPETWILASVGQTFLLESGEAFKAADYTAEGLRLLQIANVGFGRTLWEQRNFLPGRFEKEYPNLILQKGDICLALNRPILGSDLKVTRIESGDLPAILYQRVGLLRALEPSSADFGFLYFQSPFFRNLVRENLQGTDQPYLNFSLLPKFVFPFPPIAEMDEIVKRVKSLFAVADVIEQQLELSIRSAEKLTQSILAKAFRGELVPTEAELARREGRQYEPASVLLERIRAERANQEKSPTVSKRKLRRASAYV